MRRENKSILSYCPSFLIIVPSFSLLFLESRKPNPCHHEVAVGGVKFVQDEGLRLGQWRLGIFIRGNWAKNPIFDQGFKWVWLLLLMRCEGESFCKKPLMGRWVMALMGQWWLLSFDSLWERKFHWVLWDGSMRVADGWKLMLCCWWVRVVDRWKLILCGFGVLKMRAMTGLMRRKEEREGLSHQVGPTGLKVFTVLPLESVVCCLKIGPRWF